MSNDEILSDNELLFEAYQRHNDVDTEATEDSSLVAAVASGSSFRMKANIPHSCQFHVQHGNLIPFWKRDKKFAESVVNDINITLEQAWSGYTKPAQWARTKVCPICNGRGAIPNNLMPCPLCHGVGTSHASHDHSCFSHLSQDHSHHFHQTFDWECSLCHGKGEILRSPHGKNCSVCNGSGLVEEMMKEQVVVPRGVLNQFLIFFDKGGNGNLLTKAADMIVRINILEHDVFQREGDDLIVDVNITLKEALFGFNRTIKHLNGTEITIVQDEITTPLQTFTWNNMGMPKMSTQCLGGDPKDCPPQLKEDLEFGNLVMKVHVLLPKSLKDHQQQAFRSALGD
jgi:DnaJ-class molecular chaperone